MRMTLLFQGEGWAIYQRPDSKNLQLYFKPRGFSRPIRKSLGVSNLEMAKQIAEQIYLETMKEFFGLKKDPTIKDGIELFLKKSQAKKKSYKADLGKLPFIFEHFGPDTLMSEILPVNVEEFMGKITKTVSQRTGRTLTKATANRYHAFLHSVYNFAITNSLFEGKNPVSLVKKFKESRLEEYYDKDQVKEILSYCQFISSQATPDQNIVQYYFFLYAYLLSKTGARGSEILRLRWSDITPTNIFINNEGKSGKARAMMTLSGVFDTLAPFKNLAKGPHDYVIPIGYRSPSQFNRHWNKVREKFNLTAKHRMHTLRHSVATWLIEDGIPLQVVSEILGHLNLSTTNIYTHTKIAKHREKIDRAMKIV